MSDHHPLPRLVLASGSPRRRELLARYPLDIEVRPADIDESIRPGESPPAYVERLARAKAEAGRATGEVALAADTCVVMDDHILGKPEDGDHARAMLSALAGRSHGVVTAVVVADDRMTSVETVHTSVEMTPISAEDLNWYLATDEPYDKAGAYAIQGAGGRFVRRINGSYSNVVGLPLHTATRLLARHGIPLTTPSSGSGTCVPVA